MVNTFFVSDTKKIIKAHIFDIFFIVILVIALLLRIQIFRDFPFYNMADYNRDYLVAHHIVAYHEYPHAGPGNSFAKRTTSPAYFYFLAAPLFIKDNINVLGIFNVILQLLALLLIFVFAKGIFGTEAAFIAAIIFGFAEYVLNQSAFPWQPHIMQPFFILSYWLLALAYQRKSFVYLLSSVPTFFFALALHNSVLALAPLYLLVLFFILKNLGGSIRRYAIAMMACLGSLVAIHAPSVFYSSRNVLYEIKLQGTLLAPHSLVNFPSQIAMFLKIFFGETNIPLLQIFVGFTLFTLAAVYFFYSEQNILRRKFMFVILLCIIWFLFVAALLPLPPGTSLPIRFFTPILGLFAVFVAEIVGSLNGKLFYPLKIILIVSILYLSSPNLSALTQKSFQKFISDGWRYFYIPYQPPPFLAAIRDEILKIKELEKKDNYNFFGFRLCGVGESSKYACWPENDNWQIQEMFLVPLELDLKTKLAKINDTVFRGYSPLADEQYIFVMCPDRTNTTPCLNTFLQSSPYYEVQKTFWAEPYQVYLAKRHPS